MPNPRASIELARLRAEAAVRLRRSEKLQDALIQYNALSAMGAEIPGDLIDTIAGHYESLYSTPPQPPAGRFHNY